MKLDCQNCGAMVGHWLVCEVPAQERGAKSHYRCVCRQCGAVWQMDHHPLKEDGTAVQPPAGSEMAEAFGIKPPPAAYYLHSGHAWAAIEESGEVRVGLDDFSQKLLGRADELRLPAEGAVLYQDHVCLAVMKQANKASFESPVDGMITAVNPRVKQHPALLHDDPYGAGWLFKVKPTNLERNLENLIRGEKNAAWIDKEAHRLLHLMGTTAGATLPSGGGLIDEVYAHYPQVGFRRLVKEFFLTNVTRNWKKRA